MVQLKPFRIEDWMDKYENSVKYNIAETCCASISVQDLQNLSEQKDAVVIPSATKLTYGHIRGSPELRTNLANLYSSRAGTPLPPENILITPGAIAANLLCCYALIKPGDHVVVHYPTYQQLYSVPESLGAEVSLWKATAEKNWVPDLDDLKSLVRETTKLVVLNNPNNPTGAVLPRKLLQDIVDFLEPQGILILCDEVYRPVFHSISPMSNDFPPSILSLGYANTIATGSLSKAYSLAGIRVGWIASRNRETIEAIAAARHYTTISVSQLDEAVAAFALAPHTVHALLGRNIALAKTNLEILDRFVIKHDDIVEYVRPLAGTTAFLRFHRDSQPVDSEALCARLADEAGVLWAPGASSFGDEFKGYVRIGFVCETEVLKDGLEAARKWLRKEFDDLELAT